MKCAALIYILAASLLSLACGAGAPASSQTPEPTAASRLMQPTAPVIIPTGTGPATEVVRPQRTENPAPAATSSLTVAATAPGVPTAPYRATSSSRTPPPRVQTRPVTVRVEVRTSGQLPPGITFDLLAYKGDIRMPEAYGERESFGPPDARGVYRAEIRVNPGENIALRSNQGQAGTTLQTYKGPFAPGTVIRASISGERTGGGRP